MASIDIIILGYFLCLFSFALNGIMWMAIYNKHRELKIAEERILRLLLRGNLRRIK